MSIVCQKNFFLKKKEFVGQQMEFSLGSNQTDSFGPRPFPGQLVVLVTRRGRERESTSTWTEYCTKESTTPDKEERVLVTRRTELIN